MCTFYSEQNITWDVCPFMQHSGACNRTISTTANSTNGLEEDCMTSSQISVAAVARASELAHAKLSADIYNNVEHKSATSEPLSRKCNISFVGIMN